MKIRMLPVTLLSLASSLALAGGANDQGQNDERHAYGRDHGHDQGVFAAPEIDPGEAMGALVLLSGAVVIIRGYRRKK